MNTKLKTSIKGFSTFETVLFFVSLAILIVLAVLFSSLDTWLMFASSVLFLFVYLFRAKGKWYAYIFSIVSYGIYIYFSLQYNFYGEFTYSCFIILFNIFIMLQWRNNQSKNKTVLVNQLPKKEIALSFGAFVAFTVLYGLLLYFIRSEQVILNALDIGLSVYGLYFSLRRSLLQNYFYALSNVAYGMLWIMAFLQGNNNAILYAVGGIMGFLWSIYSLYNWEKMQQTQKRELARQNRK